MRKISGLRLENTYAGLPPVFYHVTNPAPFVGPRLVAFNESLAENLGVDPLEGRNPLATEYLCGKRPFQGSLPVAMYYAGHQFGVYNPSLGDGRALLLGEIADGPGRGLQLHLKGSGRTRFSRTFDGRATLRSSIREYLAGEALHHLGIPTARALCVVGSDEKIERERTETAAMTLRAARTWVRFGSFEGFHYSADRKNIEILADYEMARVFPELPRSTEEGYGLFLREIARKTAELVAMWQAFGFVHGVMNTDNMSVAGITVDYGPYGFIETFDRNHISNASDHFGRYSYANQPRAALWNLEKLAKCLSFLCGEKRTRDAVETYGRVFRQTYRELMLRKFGFEKSGEKTLGFIEKTLVALQEHGADYHLFFRNLSDAGRNEPARKNPYLEKLFASGTKWRRWFSEYAEMLRADGFPDIERKKLMDSVNPLYVLRRHVIEAAVLEAEQEGSGRETEKVRKILENPFREQPGCDGYAEPSPEAEKLPAVSCSS